MNRFSRNVALLSITVASSLVGLVGCSPPAAKESGPSYAELLSIYNSELQALDRLEGKRDELIAMHQAALEPPTEDAAQTLDSLLSSANEAVKQIDLEGVTDPNELLDRAVEHAAQAGEVASGLLESVTAAAEPTEEELQKQAELTAQFERELAAIDDEIAAQQARVDRAREARDAAEPAQQ